MVIKGIDLSKLRLRSQQPNIGFPKRRPRGQKLLCHFEL
jgi:hypothetical protein